MPSPHKKQHLRKARPIKAHVPKGAVERHAREKAKRADEVSASAERPARPPKRPHLPGHYESKPGASTD